MASTSVAEPPLFWAAPAPEFRGPGADSCSGSDQIGSASAPGTKIFYFEILKSELLMHVFLDLIYRYKLPVSHVLSKQQGFPFLLAK